MSSSGDNASGAAPADRLGVKNGMLVMEIGYDQDVDQALRSALEDATGEDLVDEDADEVVDCVLLWHRESDGDLADALVDAIGPLADDGFIWLVTPRRGSSDYVEPSDIQEAAGIAGLSQTSMATVGAGWTAVRLVGRKSAGARR